MKKEEKIVIKRSVCGIIENIRIIDVDTRPYLTSEDHCLEIAISANDITDITTLLERSEPKEISACEYIVRKLGERDNHYVHFRNILDDLDSAKNQRQEYAVILDEISKQIVICSSSKNKSSVLMRKKLNEMYHDFKKSPEQIKNSFVNSIKKKYYEDSMVITKKTISNLLSSDTGINTIKEAMSNIKEATDIDELKSISSSVVFEALHNDSINKETAMKMKSFYDYDPIFVTSVITKAVITEYCNDLVDQLSHNRIQNLEIDKVAGRKSDNEVLLSVDSDFSVTSMGNGVFNLTSRIFNAKLDREFDKSQRVLCWDCTNGYVSKCDKIADIASGAIESYDFITDGFQVIRDGAVKTFSVTGCKNFEISDGKPKISKEEFKKAKDSLMLYFYDTDDVNVAKKRREAQKRKTK